MPSRRAQLRATRLYLIVTVREEREWLAPVEAALASGCIGSVQLRDRGGDEARLIENAHALRERAHAHDALFILNDRADLAATVEADGVHVGQGDLAPAEARALVGPGRLVGLSTHDPDEVHAAGDAPVDYIGLGPAFPTLSKTLARTPGGRALIASCLSAAASLPLFPIGGITPENAHSLVSAGARRLAVGAGILAAPDPAAAAQQLDILLRDVTRT